MTPRPAGTAAIGALVVLACVARIVYPNADPSIETWIGYVVDEGRWNQSARTFALHGGLDDTSVARLHLLLAPGYQAVNFVVFKLLGIDFWTARAFSAIAGMAIILAMVLALHRRVTPVALAIGVVLLGFESNLLAASRIAIPEVPAVLGSLLAFLLLVLGPKTRWNGFIAGVMVALAVAMKATTVLVVPIFPLIVLFAPHEGRWAERAIRTGAFVGGFAASVGAGLGLGLALGFVNPAVLLDSSSRLLDYLALTGTYVTAMRFFEAPDLETRNLMLLGVWFCSWAWMFRDRRAPPGLVELYIASGAWAGWWLVTWSGNHYLPGRYVIHFVVPATIHIVAGISLLRPDLLAVMATGFSRHRGSVRFASLAWLVTPSAIVLAAMSAGGLDMAGWDTSRLSSRLGSIAAWAGALVLVAWRLRDRESAIAWFLAFPVVLTLLWLAGRELGLFVRFWQLAADPAPAKVLAFTAGTALVVAAFPCHLAVERRPAHLGWAAVVVLASVLLLQSAPALLTPTYTIRNASREIERHFAQSRNVRSFTAESLFLANTVRYRGLQSTDRDYDALVIFEHGLQPHRFLTGGRAAALERIATYPLAHHPRYVLQEPRYGPASIALYVKRP